MTWRRIRGRSVAELRDRARQAGARWLERLGAGDNGAPAGPRLDALVADLQGPAIRGPFFASLDDREGTLAALRSFDGFELALRARADRLLAGRYDLLGHRDLSFGEPVDWWLDPIAGVRAPGVHWSRIRYLDPAVVGDHKLVWELGRHQALVTLGQAWWCTGDDRYAARCARLLDGWLDANPPKRGIHWASSLEISFRAIAWVWVLALLGDALPVGTRRRMLAHLAVSGRHVERYLSTWFSPNTHLTGEALGLFVLGTALPQCRDAGRWRARGLEILLEWLPRHVRPDGTYVEQSTWYHRYTTDFCLHFLILAERAGIAVRDRVRPALEGLLDVLAWITRPDGTMPLIGDDDGGRLLFLDETTAHATRTPLAVGAALLGRADFAAVAGTATPELVWLLGADGLSSFRSLTPELPARTARRFANGGLCVMRTGWDRRAGVLTLDAGPHGFMNAGHAHADALSIDLTIGGRPLFVDPGTGSYTTSAALRDGFRSGAAHNAVTVDGVGAAEPAGPFSWAHRAEAACDLWVEHGGVVIASATHDGFRRAGLSAACRRTVVLVAPSLWIVRDELDVTGTHSLEVHWQCAPGITPRREGAVWGLHRDGAEVAQLLVDENVEWSEQLSAVAATYGVRLPAPRLTASSRRNGRQALTTVIASTPGPTRVERTAGPETGAVVRWGDRQGILMSPGGVAAGVETDARVAWIELNQDGEALLVVAAGSTRLLVSGTRVPVREDGAAYWHRDHGWR